MDNKRYGIISMIIASISFATMSVMVKLSGGGIPLYQQVFFRNFVMLIFAYVVIKKSNLSFKVKKEDRIVLFLRSFFGFIGMMCVFYSNNHMPLSDAQILQKLNPFFVILFSVLLLGESLNYKKVVTIIIGFIGALIIINPMGNFHIKPSIIGVFSALFGAIAYIMVRKLKGRVEGMVIIFYFSLLSFIFAFPMMLSVYVRPSLKQTIYLILIGVFAAMGQFFITRAFLNAKASDVTLFDYSGVIISPIFGLVIFNEAISLRTIIGMIIIITAGYIASSDKGEKVKNLSKV